MFNFEDWYKDDFLKRHGGYSPKNIQKWIDNVENTHTDIRNLLGAKLYSKYLTLKAEQGEADLSNIDPIINSILEYIPNYLNDMKIGREVFCKPTRPQGTHHAIRLGKELRDYYISRNGVEPCKEFLKLLGDLGEWWARNRTSDMEAEITISTTPKAFALIGHYGSDVDSCFKQNGKSEKDKYIIGQSENSCVVTIHKKDDSGEYKNAARCIGFLNPNGEEFDLFNYYFKPHFQEGDAIEMLRALFSEIFKSEVEFIDKHKSTFDNKIVVKNDYGQWSFIKKGRPLYSYNFPLDANGIKYFCCDKCEERFRDFDLIAVDYMQVCSNCIENANRCEITGEYTFKELIEVCSQNGSYIYVHPNKSLDFKTCEMCMGKAEELINIHDKNICLSCMDEFGRCDNCEKIILLDDIESVDDTDVCQECKEILNV